MRFSYYDATNDKLHLKTVTNDLLGGTVNYAYESYTINNPGNLKYRKRVTTQTNSGGAGTSDVVTTYKYTWAWRDSTSGEFRGHDDVMVQDSSGFQKSSTFYTNAAANGKSQADCNFLRGRPYRENARKDSESYTSISNYASDMSAEGYGRGQWTYTPNKFDFTTSSQLKIACQYGTTYNSTDNAGKLYWAPTGKLITKVEFDWETNYDHSKVLLAFDYPDHPQRWEAGYTGSNSGSATVQCPGGAAWVAFGMFSNSANSWSPPDGTWFGKITYLKIYYRDVLSSKDSSFDYSQTVGDARHVKLTEVNEYLDAQRRRTRYSYDSYGNVTDVYDDGDPNVSGIARRRNRTYVVNTSDSAWIVDRVSQEEVLDSGSNVKARTKYYYDRDGSGNRRSHGSTPTLGDLIAVERVHLADSNKTTFADSWYDAYGNLTKEQDGRGNQTEASYDSTYHAFPAAITNAKSQSETRSYNASSGKISTVTDLNSQTTSFYYDAFMRLSKVAKPGDSEGSPTTEYSYYCNTGQNAPRFAITTKQKDSSADGVLQGKSWYDGLGRVVQTRAENAAGSYPIVVDTNFDGRGLKSDQSVPYVSSSNTWDYTTRDGTQAKTQYAYEGLRRPSTITNPDSTTKTFYYPGRTTKQVDENSHQRDMINDSLDRLSQVKEYTGTYPGTLYATTTYEYDVLDNLTKITDNASNVTEVQYNSLSQKTKLHDADLSGSTDPNNAAYWWTYEYDLAGNLSRQTDAKGQAIDFAYDALNRPVRKYYAVAWVSSINGGSSRPSVYDIIELRSAVDVDRLAAGLSPVTWTDGALVAGKDVRVRAVHFTDLRTAVDGLYSAASLGSIPQFTAGAVVSGTRVIKASDPTDLRSWLSSNFEGSTWAVNNGKRARAWYRYDDYTDGQSRGYPKGQRTEMWDGAGWARWTYDTRGRVTKEERWLDGQLYQTHYTYDAMDRIATMTYPDNEVLTYSYAAHGKLYSVSSDSGVSYLQSLTYNRSLQPKVLTLGSGAATTLSYYGSGLDTSGGPYGALQRIYTSKSGLPLIQDLQHTYDSVGNLSRWQDVAASEDFSYVYDDLNRLTKRKITNGADQETFAYTTIGNVDTKNGSGYSYDGTHKHAVSSFQGTSYGYDANGNMTGAGNWTYAYDPENRMVKASNNGAVVARFAYDGDGKRVKRVDSNGTIHYAGSHYERNVGTGLDTTEKITKLYYAAGRLIALRKAGTLYYVHSDHLSGTTRVTDSSGNVFDSTSYTAYGETRSGGTNLPTDRRYTGQTLDQSSGLYWYASRPYHPVLCRFTQPDSIVPDYKNPQALNRYTYVFSNPLRYVDPSGSDPMDWINDQWRQEFRNNNGYDPGAADATARIESMAAASGYEDVQAAVGYVGSAGTASDSGAPYLPTPTPTSAVRGDYLYIPGQPPINLAAIPTATPTSSGPWLSAQPTFTATASPTATPTATPQPEWRPPNPTAMPTVQSALDTAADALAVSPGSPSTLDLPIQGCAGWRPCEIVVIVGKLASLAATAYNLGKSALEALGRPR